MKKIYLEFLRGISTIFIIGWHMAFLAPTGHPTRLTAFWGTDALIMFFMLSGLVINLSESRKPKTITSFLKNRFFRIYPQFIAGMLLAFLALILTNAAFPSLKTIIGNFFMVSTMKDYMGYIVPSIESNLPVWSLSFEMGFYVLFALTIGRRQKKMVFGWLVLSMIATVVFFLRTDRDPLTHVVAVLAFSSTWIIGYYVYEYRNYFYVEKYTVLFGLGILPLISRLQFSANFYDPLKYFIFAVFAVPFFRYCLQLPPAGKKIKMIYLVVAHVAFVIIAFTFRYMPLTNTIVYSTFPYLYMAAGYVITALGLKQFVLSRIKTLGTFLGKYSYSLYISHYTVLFVLSKVIPNVAIYILVSLPVIAFLAYCLEDWLQPAVTAFFKKPVIKSQQERNISRFLKIKVNRQI
ncbi:MAG TPA: acyltransferase family protein [Mucilaginibacter sp.]|nr:acyltransferase family protein [Mucilaginibacter sp.]